MKNILALSISIILLFSCGINKKYRIPSKENLTIEFKEQVKRDAVVGYAVSVFSADSVLYQKGFGYSNEESKDEYTKDTRQIIASISKTMIAVSVMKAQEMGILNLSDPINEHLPFRVENPFYPDEPISILDLCKHQSSIKYSEKMTDHYAFENPDMSLENYIRAYLVQGGKWYGKGNFHNNKPGEFGDYSNIGASLVAYIIERKSKMPFTEFTQKYIFTPLEMVGTVWYRNNTSKPKSNFYYNEDSLAIVKYERKVDGIYPNGDLVTNVVDLTKFCQMIMNKGRYENGLIITEKSYAEMLNFTKVKYIDGEKIEMGVFWNKDKDILGIPVTMYGYDGGDFGIYTMMYFDPKDNIGYILLANTNPTEESWMSFVRIY